MSQAVVYNGVAYLAGQVALDKPGASVTDQTKNILDRIDKYLADAGTDKSKLVWAQIWISDMDTFAEMNAVWDAWVSARQHARPRLHGSTARHPRLHRRNHGDGRRLNGRTSTQTCRAPAPVRVQARANTRSANFG